MNILKNIKLEDLPHEVLYLYLSGITGNPVGYKIYNETKAKYPEYFIDEIERERKWNNIPKSVHNMHDAEHEILYNSIYDKVPHRGKGLMFLISNKPESKEYHKAMEEAKKEYEPKAKELYNKYYKPYGIER